MKRFIAYLQENIGYGKQSVYFDNKIDHNDPILSYFRESGLLKKYEDMSPPSHEETLKEIDHINQRRKSLSDEDEQFALESETNVSNMYRKFAREQLGLNLPETFFDDVFNQTDSLLYYLKKHHNRARPEQYATANHIPFHGPMTNTAMNPAYPSGHGLDSFTAAHVLKQLKPSHSELINNFTNKIKESRVDAGVHYPSDSRISELLSNDIIKSGLLRIPNEKI